MINNEDNGEDTTMDIENENEKKICHCVSILLRNKNNIYAHVSITTGNFS